MSTAAIKFLYMSLWYICSGISLVYTHTHTHICRSYFAGSYDMLGLLEANLKHISKELFPV